MKFNNFEKNESVNNESGKKFGIMNPDGKFIRKGLLTRTKTIFLHNRLMYNLLGTGKTGDWKNHFSPELNTRLDEWIEKNLAGSDLKFITELEYQD